MCLICESGSKIRRTIFGRTCYKVLMETTDGEFRAPYHTSFVYKIGEVCEMKGLEMRCGEVNQGFHGYIRIGDSVLACKSLNAIVFPWVLSGKVPYRARGREDIDWRDDNGCWVDGGFVYSYSSRKYVVDDGAGAFAVAYECVIPAGTRYLVSADGNMYASKRLRFVERVR